MMHSFSAAGFPAIWMRAQAFSWFVAFPTLLVALPRVRRVVAFLVEAPVR